ALENARAVLAAIRRGRPGESGRGERLLVLNQTADQMFANLIALVESIEAIAPEDRDARQQDRIVTALRDVTRVLRELADRVEEERQTGTTTVGFSGAPLRESVTPTRGDMADGPAPSPTVSADAAAHYAYAASLLD